MHNGSLIYTDVSLLKGLIFVLRLNALKFESETRNSVMKIKIFQRTQLPRIYINTYIRYLKCLFKIFKVILNCMILNCNLMILNEMKRFSDEMALDEMSCTG